MPNTPSHSRLAAPSEILPGSTVTESICSFSKILSSWTESDYRHPVPVRSKFHLFLQTFMKRIWSADFKIVYEPLEF